jgi:hypothetical protein
MTHDDARILVVANETLTGDELILAVRRRAEQGPIRVTVVAPVSDPASGYVVYEHSRRSAAGRRLDRTLAQLREAGIPAHGGVMGVGPVDAVRDICAVERVDEVIVSTHARQRSGWLRRNLVDEIRRCAAPRPVEHVVAESAAQVGPANVLVIANETVLGAALLDRIRARAAEGPAAFLIVSPQSDAATEPHPAAERRLREALGELRAAGLEVHGQIAHPDPYTAAMQVIKDERVDQVIVSTFPGERSGWLRRDLVSRLRHDAGVPVEHVVVEPAAVEVTA